MKDYRRCCIDDMKKEEDIYAVLKTKNVPNVAPLGEENNINDHTTITQTLRYQLRACLTQNLISFKQYKMTLNVITQLLTTFSSSWQCVDVITDVMKDKLFIVYYYITSDQSICCEAHQKAYFDTQFFIIVLVQVA